MTRTDSIRSKVYASEHAAWTIHRGKTYTSQKQVARRAKAVVERAYIKRHYGSTHIRVEPRRANAKACCTHYGHIHVLQFPNARTHEEQSWSWTDWVICHEVSHALTANNHPSAPAHGREFAIVMLDVVRNVMGRKAHDVLKAEYRKRGVPVTKPRKRRTVTPEQRAELTDRMAKARAARDANRERMLAAPLELKGHEGRWAYAVTPEGKWVVVGPDAKRYGARSESTARQRVRREARVEAQAGKHCVECAGPTDARGPYRERGRWVYSMWCGCDREQREPLHRSVRALVESGLPVPTA